MFIKNGRQKVCWKSAKTNKAFTVKLKENRNQLRRMFLKDRCRNTIDSTSFVGILFREIAEIMNKVMCLSPSRISKWKIRQLYSRWVRSRFEKEFTSKTFYFVRRWFKLSKKESKKERRIYIYSMHYLRYYRAANSHDNQICEWLYNTSFNQRTKT